MKWDRGSRLGLVYGVDSFSKITDDEIRDFAFISKKLDEVSLSIDSLNLWVEKTASEKNINIELLNAEKEKLK